MIYPSYVQKKKSNMICSLVTISDDFNIIVADDYIYNFFNISTSINILDYVHPDFKSEIRSLCYDLGTDKSGRALVPIADGDGDYHMMDISAQAFVTIDGKLCYKLELYSIYGIEDKFFNLHFDANKYKMFLTMYQDYYFDYDISKDVFTVFKYMNIKATILIKDTLENVTKRVLEVYGDDKAKSDFLAFVESIKEAPLHFEKKFMVPDPNDITLYKMVRINAMVVHRHNKNRVVIGKIKYLDIQGEQIVPFYKTAAGLDSATGLFNKKACYEYTVDTLNNEDIHYMSIIDIDDFKNINDTYGHLFGDEVINTIAQIISGAVSGRGIVGRFGGDEFFILTSWITKEQQLRSILTSIRQKVLTAFDDRVKDLRITLSIGISKYPDDGKDYYELFKLADKCLYRAKQKGKNRYIIYNKETHAYMNDEISVLAMSHTKKMDMLAESIADVSDLLYGKDEDKINKALDFVRERYEIDGIRVYDAKLDKPVYISGAYSDMDKVKNSSCDKSCINKMFEDKKYIMINYIDNYKNDNRSIYSFCKNLGITSFMSFMEEASDNHNYYFFYDMFNNSMRWNETDKLFLLSISKLLANVLNK